MIRQRLLSPVERSFFDSEAELGGIRLGNTTMLARSTVRGVVDVEIVGRVLTELAAGHALLRAVIVDDPDAGPRFVLRDDYQPPLEDSAGGEDAYHALMNAEHDWSTGFFKAKLLRDGDRTQVVLILHHGMCDGLSVYALLGEFWERYAAHVAGSPLPPGDSDNELVDATDTQLARTVTDAEVDALLDGLRAMAALADTAPLELPRDGDGNGDPRGRLALRRLQLSPEQTADLVAAARAHQISVNSLLAGLSLAALRGQLDTDSGPVPMLAGHAVDCRSLMNMPRTTIHNGVFGLVTPVIAAADPNPIELAAAVEAGMRGALDARLPALSLRLLQREIDPATAALLAAPTVVGMSNFGRMQPLSLPQGLEPLATDLFAHTLGMAPKIAFFTIGDRLTIQFDYDTTRNSHALMERVANAVDEQIQRLVAVAISG